MPTPLMLGFDSTLYPPAIAIVRSKFRAQLAYLGGRFAITKAELEDRTTHGIWVWPVWEIAPDAPERGAPQARADFEAAMAAMQHLGIRFPGATCYFSNDSEVTNQANVEAYFDELNTLAPTAGILNGAYGSDTVLGWIRPYTKRFFQSGGGSSCLLEWAHIYQGLPRDPYGYSSETAFGTAIDVDAIFSADAGLLNLSGLYQAPKPKPQEAPMWIDVAPVPAHGFTSSGTPILVEGHGFTYLGSEALAYYLAEGLPDRRANSTLQSGVFTRMTCFGTI